MEHSQELDHSIDIEQDMESSKSQNKQEDKSSTPSRKSQVSVDTHSCMCSPCMHAYIIIAVAIRLTYIATLLRIAN